MIDHEAKCPEELCLCDFSCGKKLVKREMEKHNHESLLIHVQCLKRELDSERKQRQAVEGEMEELKKMLGGKEVIEYFVAKFRREMTEIAPWKKINFTIGVFDSCNTTSGLVISDDGRKVTGLGRGTAGCGGILSQ